MNTTTYSHTLTAPASNNGGSESGASTPKAPEKNSSSSRQAAESILPWWIQTLATFFALSSFSVLIVVLKHYEGISPTAWPFGVLTLNGLVALLSTITRVTLLALLSTSLSQGKWIHFAGSRRRPLAELELHDEASRSVWGSILYLCQMRGFYIATIGAILTVLTLAFDVFAQQVISFETHPVIVNATTQAQFPTVPRAEIFVGTQQSSGSEVVNPGLPMEAAWQGGLLTLNTTELQPVCPTGNCPWPVVSSLAVCGACTDVSSDLKYAEGPPTGFSSAFNFTLPDGSGLVNVASPTTVFRLNVTAANTSYPDLRYKSVEQDRENGYLMLAHFEVISQRETAKPPVEWGLNETVAYECAMWYCIEAYNISMTNGQLNQTTVAQWNEVDPRSVTEDSLDEYRYSSDLLNFTTPPPEFNIPEGTTWAVGVHAFRDIRVYLDSFFPMVKQQMDANYLPSTANGIWASIHNMDTYIANFARTMTHAVRISSLTSPIGEIYYQGIAYKDETYTAVRWAWLAFPAAMLVGSCLLLLVTVWRTERSPVGAWKASSLSLLFIRMGERFHDSARGQMTSESEALASKVGKENVRLSCVDGEWRLDCGMAHLIPSMLCICFLWVCCVLSPFQFGCLRGRIVCR